MTDWLIFVLLFGLSVAKSVVLYRVMNGLLKLEVG